MKTDDSMTPEVRIAHLTMPLRLWRLNCIDSHRRLDQHPDEYPSWEADCLMYQIHLREMLRQLDLSR